jgi:hypothetical protein
MRYIQGLVFSLMEFGLGEWGSGAAVLSGEARIGEQLAIIHML